MSAKVSNKTGKQTVGNSIVYINVNKIEPHPDNPRKDIGDISELAESVKRDGIRQNLTVIPYEQGYRCLIGHRRLAAAKLSGLDQVPCVIERSDMTRNEQIAIMLSENMQRVDLTPIEEAESMQLMLDLGDTVEGVAEKTGLSKSTVYRRINPLKEYGQERVAQAFEHGATFSDFEKLNEISDPKTRAEVAAVLGTPNFDYRYTKARREEQEAKVYSEALETLKSYAVEITEAEKQSYKYINYISRYTASSFKKPDDTNSVKYFYSEEPFGANIYREYTSEEFEEYKQKSQEDAALAEQRDIMNKHNTELKQLTDIAAELRHNFIVDCNPLKGCTQKQAQLDAYKQLCGFFIKAYINFPLDGKWDSYAYFINNIGKEADEFKNTAEDKEKALITEHISSLKNWEIKSLLALLIASVESACSLKYYDYSAKYLPCEKLDFIYEVLCAFGYEMSDIEKQLQDGTHELFMGRSNFGSSSD